MDTGFLANLNQLLQSHPLWLVVLAFVFALLESLAIVGIVVPGIVLLFIVGAVIGTDMNLFFACWLAAAAGALTGDLVSHWIGSHFRDHVPRLWPLNRRPDMLVAARTAVEQHGGKGVIIGRFVGPLRPVVPMAAGMMGMRLPMFVLFAVPACLLWAPAYLVPGMLFGASLELAADFAGRLVVVLLIVVLGLWLVIWLTRVTYSVGARRGGWWMKSLIRWSSEHPLIGRLVAPLFEPGQREMISVALLGLLLVASLAVLLAVLALAPFASTAWDAQEQFAGWAASLRSHLADPFFVALALIGELQVMGMLAAIMTLLLIVLRRTNAAWHWLVATAGAWLLAELLNGVMGFVIESPERLPGLGEVPHRGVTLTTVTLGFFAVMLAKDLNASRRKWPYLFATGLLSLICFAHFYLDRASVSGIVAALALGGGWLALVGIGYRQRTFARRRPEVIAAAFYGLLVLLAGSHIQSEHRAVLEESRVHLPEIRFDRDQWREEAWRDLPHKRSRIGREAVQRFDLQWAGQSEALRETLIAANWRQPPDWQGRRRMIVSPVADPARMPHLPRDFAGRPEALVKVAAVDEDKLAVLRLWASRALLDPDGEPVWLGQVRVVRPVRFLGVFNRWQEVDSGHEAARTRLQLSLEADDWEVVETDYGSWLVTKRD